MRSKTTAAPTATAAAATDGDDRSSTRETIKNLSSTIKKVIKNSHITIKYHIIVYMKNINDVRFLAS